MPWPSLIAAILQAGRYWALDVGVRGERGALSSPVQDQGRDGFLEEQGNAGLAGAMQRCGQGRRLGGCSGVQVAAHPGCRLATRANVISPARLKSTHIIVLSRVYLCFRAPFRRRRDQQFLIPEQSSNSQRTSRPRPARIETASNPPQLSLLARRQHRRLPKAHSCILIVFPIAAVVRFDDRRCARASLLLTSLLYPSTRRLSGISVLPSPAFLGLRLSVIWDARITSTTAGPRLSVDPSQQKSPRRCWPVAPLLLRWILPLPILA